MIITYTPEGGEEQQLDAGRLRTSEIQIVERTADLVWPDVRQGLKDGNVTAIRAVAWVLLKRDQPGLKYGEFDPFEDQLGVRLDPREVERYAEFLTEAYRDEPEALEAAMAELQDAALDQDHATQVIAEAANPGPKEASGTSPSPSSG
ncbi:hypothetical protein [Streptomyces sp. NPDC051219]|uniref:hypothetical protein n=1 Tax=Streptomyces sp. NPDC051219 TaxID=3155283 RepID=UPI0034121ABD